MDAIRWTTLLTVLLTGAACSGSKKWSHVMECPSTCSDQCKFKADVTATWNENLCGGQGGYGSVDVATQVHTPAKPCTSTARVVRAKDYLTWTLCDGTRCTLGDRHFVPRLKSLYDPGEVTRPWVGKTTQWNEPHEPLSRACYNSIRYRQSPPLVELQVAVRSIDADLDLDLICLCRGSGYGYQVELDRTLAPPARVSGEED